MEDLFKYFTPLIYWVLIIIWLYILIFYFLKLKRRWKRDELLGLLLIILSIDAFRTLLESTYFGLWYTSLSGLIPIHIFNFLAQPQIVFFPKIINLIAAILILTILINKWLPSEIIQKERTKTLIKKQSSELLKKNKELIDLTNALQESESLYRETQRISKMGGWIYDVESKQTTFTDTIYEIYGKKFSTTEEGIEFYHPDDKERVWNSFNEAITKQKPYDLQVRFINAQGNTLFVRTLGQPLVKNGKVVKIYGNLIDISDCKKTEEALRKSESTIRNKLKAITEYKGDIESLDLNDIIDVDVLQSLITQFYKVVPVAISISDLSGKSLVSAGWQDICTKFHRCHPETALNCHKNDTVVASSVPFGTSKNYHCKNNMRNMAAPVEINGKHFGNVFIGQFFYTDEEPDINIFRQMALQYGFDEAEYLAALGRVPRLTRQTADASMAFLSELAKLISRMSFSTIQQTKLLAERKLSEQSLRESKEKFSSAFNKSPIPLAITDFETGERIAINDKYAEIFGYSRVQILSGNGEKNNLAAETKALMGAVDHSSRESFLQNYPFRMVTKDGNVRDILVSAARINNENKSQFIVSHVDITEQKQAEKELTESRDLLRSVLENIPIRVFWKDTDFRYLGCNTLFAFDAGMLRPEDVIGKDNSQLGWGEEVTLYNLDDKLVIDSNTPKIGYEEPQSTPDGHTKCLHSSKVPLHDSKGKVIGVLGIYDDITEQKQAEREHKILEDQLQQAQKMESVGRLAGGVAHDYNNISSIILGYSELALARLEKSDPLYGYLMEINTAVKRSTSVTRQLLAFARKQTVAPRVLDLNDTIGDMLKMLQRLIGEDIDIVWKPGDEIRPIKIDPTQINQIMANLCVNAKDAIANVGKVTVETKNITFNENDCTCYEGFVPGEYVQLSVSDNGFGMTPETRDKIFEPFFTTKVTGKGTGLGLSTVYGIVKQNNGFINVCSEMKKGTIFRIYFPVYTEQTVKVQSEKKIQLPLSRGETILLVEDDDSILKMVKRMVEKLEYAVLFSSSPVEAVKLATEHADDIHLLITDVVMPAMNGRELSERLKSHYPHLKTLFMSGYTADIIAPRGVLKEGVNFIEKPFSNKELALKIREILDKVKG
ncbi:PocR ligand-binding domain-containing protein [Desulforhopalus vacuolatus]|uniref:PocR ligand-binding domain-containing protein n=1 Tax=Desulforhopalus vacuolatus TaxID=40414 RepID=UPI0019654867|nr:PocR ligand-binding domain-containing protein [Desulforhopalus vacuolatus]MBM9520238.1 PocR ligand-binding domain-containing protein [Desulforhopalus vacuolatus]